MFGAAVGPDGRASPALLARCAAAADLARATPGARLLVSGGVGRWGEAESALMAEAIAARGIDPARIAEEPTARDTVENVLAAAALLRGRVAGPGGRVLAVTHGYHLPRCVALLRLARLPAEAGAAAVPDPRRPVTAWLWRRLREAIALPWDLLQVRLRR